MGREDLCIEFLRDHKVREDPRITRFGKLLRRTSFDELPQLYNVLRGELSLIGPRPITPEELERYGSQRVSFLALKPGITGLWQVSGRNDVSYDERVKLDIYYIENWSVKLDLAILARTTAAVIARRGAYWLSNARYSEDSAAESEGLTHVFGRTEVRRILRCRRRADQARRRAHRRHQA